MKSTLSYNAFLLLAAGLASAAPMTSGPGSVIVTIKSGNGDSASNLRAGIGSITLTAGNTAKSVKASLSHDKTWCGGFKDASATNLWLNYDGTDGIFSTGVDAHYSSKSDGGVASNPHDAITVASYWCADSMAGVRNRIQKRTHPPRERHNDPTPSPLAPGQGGVATGPTARLTLELEAQTTFVQQQFPINGQPTPFNQALVSMSFVSPIAGVSCQAFNGRSPVGNAAQGNTAAILGVGPTQITAIQCSSNAGGNAPATPAAPVTAPSDSSPAPGNNGATGATVNIQIETERQTTFFGEKIAANGQPQQTRQKAAISISVQSADGMDAAKAQCDVLSSGKVISKFTALDAAVLTTGNHAVAFDAVQCKS